MIKYCTKLGNPCSIAKDMWGLPEVPTFILNQTQSNKWNLKDNDEHAIYMENP